MAIDGRTLPDWAGLYDNSGNSIVAADVTPAHETIEPDGGDFPVIPLIFRALQKAEVSDD